MFYGYTEIVCLFVCLFANFGTGTDPIQISMRSWSEAFLAMDLIRTIM